MLGEFFAIITMLAAVGVGVWALDWVQRGWSEIVEPREAWGDRPAIPDEAIPTAAEWRRGAAAQGSSRDQQCPVSHPGHDGTTTR